MSKIPSVCKILQALYYIQSHAPQDNEDRFSKVYLLKMLYFADRYHIRHYGNLLSNDSYVAMKLGPVASITYDILKKLPTLKIPPDADYLSAVKELDEYDVVIEIQGDNKLSKSAKIALDFTVRENGRYDWKKQSRLSHCFPEWKKHETMITAVNPSVAMDLRDFFDDPDDDACFRAFDKKGDPFKEDKEFLMLLRDDLYANTVSS